MKLAEGRRMKIYQCFPNEQILDFWVKNHLNVLFFGRHGVGKTSMILESFERNGIRYKQFSAATMDPWVDFIGVPKEMKDDKGSYLELIRPKDFRDDEVEAIFFDELNRSHKKVRNAVMELIQFKSINGKKYPNLKMIWGAVNPEEDDSVKYDVEKLDPAQQDRFHIQIEIPYKPYMPYFVEKFGKEKAQAAIDWWNQLPENIRLEVSPRRLEYAIKIGELGGNLIHVLPPYSNVEKLAHALKHGSPLRDYRALIKEGNEAKISTWLSEENNYDAVRDEIIKNPEPVLHLIGEEKAISLASISKSCSEHLFNNYDKFKETIKSIAEHSGNKALKKAAISVLQANTGQSNPIQILKLNMPNVPATVRNQQSSVATSYIWNNSCKIGYSKTSKKIPHGYELTIAGCINAAMNCGNQTYERIRICKSLIRILTLKSPTALTKEDALICLQLFEWFSSKTQETTIKNIEDIEVAINNCVQALRANNEFEKVSDFATKFPFISGKIMASSTGDYRSRCLVPN